jgi:hypothetical protein
MRFEITLLSVQTLMTFEYVVFTACTPCESDSDCCTVLLVAIRW